MLKHIPTILSPELVKILMEMGHGDEILLADANYPGHRYGQRVVRLDGIDIPQLLSAILELFPLDAYADYQYRLMSVVEGDPTVPIIWDDYHHIIRQHFPNAQYQQLARETFYEQSKENYAIVMTGERALYGNIILKKGVI